MAFYRKYGISVRIGRIFNTYGPRMDPEDGRVISNFIVQSLRGEPITIYGDGTQTRSFIYVDDLIKGVLSLMEVEYCSPVNLGNPEEYRILDLAQLIRDLVGSSSPLIFKPLPEDDPKRRCPDIRLAKKLFSFRPETPLREGLKKTIDYFREIVFL
jgi:dTDP-glucose 4,6-dehydratase